MRIDRKAFYDRIRQKLGPLTQSQVDGFELLIDEYERRNDPLISRGDFAYMLATAWWETGKTMQPVREAFYLGEKAEAWRKRNLRYYPYYGRGFVQLTWERNYKLASDKLGVNFVSNPDLVMRPDYAVKIMFEGMLHGWFTGKALDDYIDDVDEGDSEDLREFIAARRIINGTDKAATIGDLALTFEGALKAAPAAPIPRPAPRTPAAEPVGPLLRLLQFVVTLVTKIFTR